MLALIGGNTIRMEIMTTKKRRVLPLRIVPHYNIDFLYRASLLFVPDNFKMADKLQQNLLRVPPLQKKRVVF